LVILRSFFAFIARLSLSSGLPPFIGGTHRNSLQFTATHCNTLCFNRTPITLFWLAAIYRSVAVRCSILLQWVAVCWAMTFGYSEKHFCFYRAHITLFWLAAI